MRVDVLHAVGRLAGQTRCVEVVDVRDFALKMLNASNTSRALLDSR